MKRLRSSACYVPQAVKVAWIVHLVSSHLIGSCGRFYLSSSASLLAVFPSWFFSPTSTRRSRYSAQCICSVCSLVGSAIKNLGLFSKSPGDWKQWTSKVA